MRNQLFAVLFIAAIGCGPDRKAAPQIIPAASAGTGGAPIAAVAPAPPAAQDDVLAGTVLEGTVLEKIDATQYTYLRLQTAGGEAWAAVSKSPIAVGATARITGAMWMQDFKSPSMNRTWARIAFGTLDSGAASAPAQPQGRSAGMFAQAAMGQPELGGQPGLSGQGSSRAPPPDGAPIAVPAASGQGARTIAEVYAQRTALKDQVVRVSGKVVKETDHVLGKNWLHLRDGSGKDAAADLAFATDDASAVGQTVVLSGVVHLDRDLGAGYHYDVLIEDAHLEQR